MMVQWLRRSVQPFVPRSQVNNNDTATYTRAMHMIMTVVNVSECEYEYARLSDSNVLMAKTVKRAS